MNASGHIFERLRSLRAAVADRLDDSGGAILAPCLHDAPQRLSRPGLVGLALVADMLRALVSAERACPQTPAATGAEGGFEGRTIVRGLLGELARAKPAYRAVCGADSAAAAHLLEAYLLDAGAFGFRCDLTAWSAAKTCVRAAGLSGDAALLVEYAAIVRETVSCAGFSPVILPAGLDEALTHAEAPPAARQIALEWAILGDDVDGVARLAGPQFAPERKLSCGLTPWGLAEGTGRRNVAAWLLEAGARRTAQQALVVASACWDAETVKTLLRSGASPHGSVPTADGRCSPLEAAATPHGDRWRALLGRPQTAGILPDESAADRAATVQALMDAGAFPDSIRMQA